MIINCEHCGKMNEVPTTLNVTVGPPKRSPIAWIAATIIAWAFLGAQLVWQVLR